MGLSHCHILTAASPWTSPSNAKKLIGTFFMQTYESDLDLQIRTSKLFIHNNETLKDLVNSKAQRSHAS